MKAGRANTRDGYAKLESTALYPPGRHQDDPASDERAYRGQAQTGAAARLTRGSRGPPGFEVADIFRDHGPAWQQANAGHVSLSQLKVMAAIESCRTAAVPVANLVRLADDRESGDVVA